MKSKDDCFDSSNNSAERRANTKICPEDGRVCWLKCLCVCSMTRANGLLGVHKSRQTSCGESGQQTHAMYRALLRESGEKRSCFFWGEREGEAAGGGHLGLFSQLAVSDHSGQIKKLCDFVFFRNFQFFSCTSGVF